METKEIAELIELMTKGNLSEIEVEREGFRLRLRKELPPAASHPQMIYASPTSIVGPEKPRELAAPSSEAFREIRSPMVGVFYRAPAPGAPACVEVGQEIHENTVVCIIEAMKVMNEIKAELHGIITEVLVEDGKAVDFDRPLFRVRPLP
ncbi:acetyl-CoA carboxylase biotin carboxyl carrier protein [Verrucomicrobium sp. 3C]|uniref:acetyl-CoA carboxylase biotin carboxyl carrier protein n=1 Tax=Verrucomicrobium sp. 3C TaxID=1134055 RepID=UPI00036BE6DE|nr:acetyl-CoA carboxylase biotin carboxyl carrier protein [Verrucomicrobium sp. 3C]